MFKKFLIVIPIIVLSLLSCKDKDDDVVVSASPSNIVFPRESKVQTISVFGNETKIRWKMTFRKGAESAFSFSETETQFERSGKGDVRDIPIYAKFVNETRASILDTLDLVDLDDPLSKRVITLDLEGYKLTISTADTLYYIGADQTLFETDVVNETDTYSVVEKSSNIGEVKIEGDKLKVNFVENTSVHYIVGKLVLKGSWIEPKRDTTYTITFNQDGVGSIETDKQNLWAFYNATEGSSSWTTKWNEAQDVSTWNGVDVGKVFTSKGYVDRVIGLNVASQNITGAITDHLSNMTYLQTLRLNSNKLSGNLPSSIFLLRDLTLLWLGDNSELTGNLGTEAQNLGALSEMRSLSIINTKMTGDIPASIGNLIRLSNLQLANNNFTGELPAEIGGLKDLRYITLNGNRFTGAIPQSFRLNAMWPYWNADVNIRPQQNSVVLQ